MRAFGVGAAKTGTHSLAAMLARGFRTKHEPDSPALIQAILARHAGALPDREFRVRIHRLLEGDDLEIGVSQIYGFIIDVVVKLYPQALYILTVRDCRSWLRSLINHQLTRPLAAGSPWGAFRDLRFNSGGRASTAHDKPMLDAGLYGLDGYLGYWASHTEKVVRHTPPDRLLVIPTNAIAREAPSLAAALGGAPGVLSPDRVHHYAGRYVDSPLDRLDQVYLEERLAAHTTLLRERTAPNLSPRGLAGLDEALQPL